MTESSSDEEEEQEEEVQEVNEQQSPQKAQKIRTLEKRLDNANRFSVFVAREKLPITS